MNRKSKIRKILSGLTAVILCLALLVVPDVPQVRADAVTDKLAVRVGYAGMELSEFVEVGDYHWSELAKNLDIYEQAFSFYRSGNSSGTKFSAIVDSAKGFRLRDLLDYAGVHYGDIRSLQFYVVDHKGIQAAFDRDELFKKRYYFKDYNGHLKRHYNDDFEVDSVDSSECWHYCTPVEPMMALEDNWASFSEEYEHALPDFENMGTQNRFRLLFGQTKPEESMTKSSAKYVRCIYVTLTGKPKVGDIPKLDGTYGSHEVTMTVKVDDTMRDAISEFMRIKSTDEKVMKVKKVTVTPDRFYEDQAKVTVEYEIVGDGTAALTVGYGSSDTVVSTSDTVTAGGSQDETKSSGDTGSPSDGESGGDSSKDSGSSQDGGSSKDNGSSGNGGADSADTPSKTESEEIDESATPESPMQAENPDGTTSAAEKSGDGDSGEKNPSASKKKSGSGSRSETAKADETEAETDDTSSRSQSRSADESAAVPDSTASAEELPEEQAETADTLEGTQSDVGEVLDGGSTGQDSGTGSSVFLLSSDIQKKLLGSADDGSGGETAQGSSGSDSAAGGLAAALPAGENITEVRMKDNSEEEKKREKKILILVGIASVLLVAAGAVTEELSFAARMREKTGFRKRRKKKGRKN